MKPADGGEVMDIVTMLNNKKGNQIMTQQFAANEQHLPQMSLMRSDSGLERSASPHGSEHSSYSNVGMSRPYGSPGAMQASMPMGSPLPSSMQVHGFPDMSQMHSVPSMSMPQSVPQQQQQQSQSAQAVKAYPCSSCGKGFARRSDLARHERIHSGVRPHVCDFPNCGKMFIQRSALTVHQRVHTGEKPHHCEICAKPFSDSSSLARHRRTHSGTRPYKCPYADCQKTFTRRTTLTRHQNLHSGTVEEAAAATAAALAASRPRGVTPGMSESDHLSNHDSPMSTPSPAHRGMSMSPSIDLSGASGMARHTNDFQYLQQGGPLPVHLRVGSPVSTSSGGYNTGIRPTSHPTGYGPPPTLEPSVDQHQSAPGSAVSSPHMSSVGWQSPSHMSPANIPTSHNGHSHVFPDPGDYSNNAAMSQMYYGQMRRPQSAEPGMVHMA